MKKLHTLLFFILVSFNVFYTDNVFCAEETNGYETDSTDSSYTTAREDYNIKPKTQLSSLAVQKEQSLPRISSQVNLQTYDGIMSSMGFKQQRETLHDKIKKNTAQPPLFTAVNASKMILAPSVTLFGILYFFNKMGTSLKLSLPTLSIISLMGIGNSYYCYKSADATLYQDTINILLSIKKQKLQHIEECLMFQKDTKKNPFSQLPIFEATFSLFSDYKIGQPLFLNKKPIEQELNNIKTTLELANTYCQNKPFTIKIDGSSYPIFHLIRQEQTKIDRVQKMLAEAIK